MCYKKLVPIYLSLLILSPLSVLPDYVRTLKSVQSTLDALKIKPGYRDDFPSLKQQTVSKGGDVGTDSTCTDSGCIGEVTIKTPIMLERGFVQSFTAIPKEPHLAPLQGRIWIPEFTSRVSLGFQYFAPVADICHLFGIDDSTASGKITTTLGNDFVKSCTDSARLTATNAEVSDKPVTYSYQTWTVTDLDTKYKCGHWTADSMEAKQGVVPMIKDTRGAAIYSIHEEPDIVGSICIELGGKTTCADVKSDTQTGVQIEVNGNIVEATFDDVIKPTRMPTGFMALKFAASANATLRPTEIRYATSIGRDTPPLKGSVGEFRTNCKPVPGSYSCGLQTYDLRPELMQTIEDYDPVEDASAGTAMKEVFYANSRQVNGHFIAVQDATVGTYDFGISALIMLILFIAACIAAITAGGVAAGAADNHCTVKRTNFVPDSRFDTLYDNLVPMDNKIGKKQMVMPEALPTSEAGVGLQTQLDLLDYDRIPGHVTLRATGLKLDYVEDLGRVVSFSIPKCKMYTYSVGSYCHVLMTYEGQPGQFSITCKPYVCLRSYLNVQTGDLMYDIGMQSPGVDRAKPTICYHTGDGEKCHTAVDSEFQDQVPPDYGSIGESDGQSDSAWSGSFWDVLTKNIGVAALFFILIIVSIVILILDIFLMKHVITIALGYVSAKKNSEASAGGVESEEGDQYKITFSPLITSFKNILTKWFSIYYAIFQCLNKTFTIGCMAGTIKSDESSGYLPVDGYDYSGILGRLGRNLKSAIPQYNKPPKPDNDNGHQGQIKNKTEHAEQLAEVSTVGIDNFEASEYVSLAGKPCKWNNDKTIYFCSGTIIYHDKNSGGYVVRGQGAKVKDLHVIQHGRKRKIEKSVTRRIRSTSLCSALGVLEPFCNSTTYTPIADSGVGHQNFDAISTFTGTFYEACLKFYSGVYDCASVKIEVLSVTSFPNAKSRDFMAGYYFPGWGSTKAGPGGGTCPTVPNITSINLSGGTFYHGVYWAEIPVTGFVCDSMTAGNSNSELIGFKSDYAHSTGLPKAKTAIAWQTEGFYNTTQTWVSRHYGNEMHQMFTMETSTYNVLLHYTPLASVGIFNIQSGLSLGRMFPVGTVSVPVYIEMISILPMSNFMRSELIRLVGDAVTMTGSISWDFPFNHLAAGYATNHYYLQLTCADQCTVSYKATYGGKSYSATMITSSNARKGRDLRTKQITQFSDGCDVTASYLYVSGVAYSIRPGIGSLILECGKVNSSATWLKMLCYGKNYHAYVEACDKSYVSIKMKGGHGYPDIEPMRVDDERYTVKVAPVTPGGQLLDAKIVSFDGKSLVNSEYILYSYSDKQNYIYSAGVGEQIKPINGTGKTINVFTSLAAPDQYNVVPPKVNCEGFTNAVKCLVTKYPELYVLPVVGLILVAILLGFMIGRCVLDCEARKIGYSKGALPFKYIGGKLWSMTSTPAKKAYSYVTKSGKKVQVSSDEVSGQIPLYENIPSKTVRKRQQLPVISLENFKK